MDAKRAGTGRAESITENVLLGYRLLDCTGIGHPGELLQVVHENRLSINPSVDCNNIARENGSSGFRGSDWRGPQMPLAIGELHKCESRIVRRPEGLLDVPANEFGGFFGSEVVEKNRAVFWLVLMCVEKPFAIMGNGQLGAFRRDQMSCSATLENDLSSRINVSHRNRGLGIGHRRNGDRWFLLGVIFFFLVGLIVDPGEE